jgi:hypothetical protein
LATDAGLEAIGAVNAALVNVVDVGVGVGTTAPPVCASAEDGASSAQHATTYAVVRDVRPTIPLEVCR